MHMAETILTLILNHERRQVADTLPGKSKARGVALPDVQLRPKAAPTRTVWYWRQTGAQAGGSGRVQTRGARKAQQGKVWGKLGNHLQRNQTGPHLTPLTATASRRTTGCL